MASTTSGQQQRGWLRYGGMGFEFFAVLVVCVLVGIWLDGRFGWSPWGVLGGSAVGLVVSMWKLIRQGLAMQREADSQRRSRQNDLTE